MATTPAITLTANLDSIIAAAAEGGYLRITLCGYGPQMPAIPGTCMLADAGVPQMVGPQSGTAPLSVALFGNDVIQPPNTFYEISLLDENRDVIQSGIYQFSGTGSQDLSQAMQILSPYNLGFVLANLRYAKCTVVPASGGTVFTAPTSKVIAIAYNGVLVGAEFYTTNGAQITLKGWTTESGDRIDAFCI